ncbi:MAG: MucR family transcriptional regulator [Desulfurivibrionaceae bacterium]
MGKSLVEMAADIVKSQCCANSMSTEEIRDSLVQTYQTLSLLNAGLKAEDNKVEESPLQEPEYVSTHEAAAEKAFPVKRIPVNKKGGDKKKKPSPSVSAQDSIQQDQVICLECGNSYKVLSSKHLKKHGLSAREYRKKYGFSLRQPLCSKTLSEKRKKAGEERGAPENLLKAIAGRKKSGQAES